MNLIWIDWVIIIVGILAVTWAVWRTIKKDKMHQKGADSEDYLFGKGEPWYIIGAAIFAANIGSEHLVVWPEPVLKPVSVWLTGKCRGG
jgi:SSS family solute:Na+ symporter